MASSSLPNTPAGRRQAVESMFEVGFITKEQALELMQLPDVEAVLSRETARVELPLMQLESIIEDGIIIPPIPYQPLPETLATAQATFMRAMIDDLPSDRLDLLAQFIDAVQGLIDDAKQAAMQEAAAVAPAAPAIEQVRLKAISDRKWRHDHGTYASARTPRGGGPPCSPSRIRS